MEVMEAPTPSPVDPSPDALLPGVEMVRDILIIFLLLMGCLLYDVGHKSKF